GPGGRGSCRANRIPHFALLMANFAFCIAFGCPLREAAAQGQKPPPPLRMQVELGFNGYVRAGRAAPVRVTFDNDGEAVQGRLEVREPEQEPVTETPVSLPRRSHQQFALFVTPHAGEAYAPKTPITARLLAGRRTLAEQKVVGKVV